MKYLKPINEFWGDVLKRDLLGETREEDKFRSIEDLIKYLKYEIEKQGKNVVIQDIDVSLVEDLKGLFCAITKGVKSLDLSGWKTSGAKNMSSMFWGCSTIESLNLSGWDTSNVENMKEMFSYCDSLKSLDVSGWNTSNVKNMNGMFYYCRNLESLDLSGWDTSNVENMDWMFYKCPALYDNKLVRK